MLSSVLAVSATYIPLCGLSDFIAFEWYGLIPKHMIRLSPRTQTALDLAIPPTSLTAPILPTTPFRHVYRSYQSLAPPLTFKQQEEAILLVPIVVTHLIFQCDSQHIRQLLSSPVRPGEDALASPWREVILRIRIHLQYLTQMCRIRHTRFLSDIEGQIEFPQR